MKSWKVIDEQVMTPCMKFIPLRASDRRIGSALIFASVFSVALLVVRMFLTQKPVYSFLIWNLFLAWIPLVCAWLVSHTQKPPSAWKTMWIAIFLWLLFFPNSPYILTDLGHLARIDVWSTLPLGFDVVMLLAFTLNGLLLGFVSLFIIERVWRQHFTSRVATTLSLVSLFLAGFGIYLGRFLRWNSWDLFHTPLVLVNDLVVRIINPLSHGMTWGFTALYSSFLIAIYIAVRFWRSAPVEPVVELKTVAKSKAKKSGKRKKKL